MNDFKTMRLNDEEEELPVLGGPVITIHGMTDSQTKERYAHLAEKWGCTQKKVAEASKWVFNSIYVPEDQYEYEEMMKAYIDGVENGTISDD